MQRCDWAGTDPLNIAYHDEEWGIPVRDEHRLYEILTLESAQAGLSWLTILRKRNAYRVAFAGFDPRRVAGFDEARIDALIAQPAIVRHPGKIRSAVHNARRILALRDAGNSLSEVAWSVVGGVPRVNSWHASEDVPSMTAESAALSRRLKELGFRFVGPTTCYAFMQAAGLVNDHLVSCFRHPAR